MRPVQRQHLEAGNNQGSALAQQQVGAVHRGERQGADPAAARRLGRGAELRGERREDRGRPHAPRLHPQHHQPLGDGRPGDPHVGQRGLQSGQT